MNSIVLYLLQVIIASGLLYGYYHLFLRNNRFHQYNRFYLLATLAISLLIPFVHVPVYFESAEKIPVLYRVLAEVKVGKQAAVTEHSAGLGIQALLPMIYALIVLLLALRFVSALLKLNALYIRNRRERIGNIAFVHTSEKDAPYSFFNWLFWNKRIALDTPKGQQIFKHELYHIRQRHSYDVVFSEIVTTLFWINPFYHLVKRELRTIHEFLADQYASEQLDRLDYAELLVLEALENRQRLVNPFFHTQIKRRIAMITNPTQTSYQYLRKVLALPIIAFTVTLVAIQCKSKDDVLAKEQEKEPIVIEERIAKTDSVTNSSKTNGLGVVEEIRIETDNKIFTKVEIEAAYKGGVNAWKKFLQQTLNANVPIDNGAPVGTYTVLVEFIVNSDGKASNFKTITKNGYGMEEEVLRVMKLSGDWLPAIQHGQKVSAYRRQPVTFSVTEE